MKNFNQTLLDKAIAHDIGIERLKAGLSRKYDKELSAIDAEILGLFILAIGATKAEQSKIFAKIKKLKAKSYNKVNQGLIDDLVELAQRQSGWFAGTLGAMLIPSMINKPTVKASLIQNMEVRGKKVSAHIEHLMESEIDRLYTLARTAVSDGLSVKESKEAFKLLAKKRNNQIRSIVATATAGAVMIADNAVFKSNTDIIKGVKIAVVFDNRTTPICIQHSIDDILYPVNDYPHAPYHFGCRSRIIAVIKSWAELGAKMKRKVPVGTRASMTGTTTIDKTYSQWLKRQSKEIQIDALGETRARLFRSGKLTLDKFIDPTGKYYTIDELFSKYDI